MSHFTCFFDPYHIFNTYILVYLTYVYVSFKDELTPKEECIIKHKVNCGRPKDRLTLFLLGMDSVKKKVYQVILKECGYNFNVYIYIQYRSKFCPSRRKLLFFS